mmetsp:Transcript_118612/g.382958  ORF Transcript_118612/g.382958 Transcript_118612/m.382958 type:complete len:218 (+) Transcript_118612:460-1113(+)
MAFRCVERRGQQGPDDKLQQLVEVEALAILARAVDGHLPDGEERGPRGIAHRVEAHLGAHVEKAQLVHLDLDRQGFHRRLQGARLPAVRQILPGHLPGVADDPVGVGVPVHPPVHGHAAVAHVELLQLEGAFEQRQEVHVKVGQAEVEEVIGAEALGAGYGEVRDRGAGVQDAYVHRLHAGLHPQGGGPYALDDALGHRVDVENAESGNDGHTNGTG